MLFSQPELADFLNTRFECIWQSVRPVPKVTIDFGDGRVLERTLAGNVATWILTRSGRAIDLVPGVLAALQYRQELEDALALHAELVQLEGFASFLDPAQAERELVARYHGAALQLAALAPEAARAAAEQEILSADLAKMMVEGTLRRSVGELLRAELARPLAQLAPEAPLAHDTAFNLSTRAALVHALLAAEPLAEPGALTARVYREILHVDLEDPWLGLAPDVLGGELGRHEPAPAIAATLP